MAQFRIPDIEQFLPRGASVDVGSGLQPHGPVAANPLSFGIDDDAVADFLSNIEQARPPEPQKLKTWQKVVGAIGDALSVYAQSRLGSPTAVGPFAAQQMREREAHRTAQAEADKFNRQIRSQAGLIGLEEKLRTKRETEVAKLRQKPVRQQLKTFKTTDEGGRPIEIPYSFDPVGNTLNPVEGYEEGFRQYVRPFLAQGVNTETGELEFRLVDPTSGLAPQGVVGQASAGLGTLEPKPTAGEAESVEAAGVISSQLSEFEKLASEYSQSAPPLGFVRALGQQAVRAAPGGQALAEGLGDPGFEQLAALRDRIGQQLARLVESGRLSDQDRDFALRNLPTVPSLRTEAGRRAAAGKIALVRDEINLRMARKKRLRPGLAGGDEPVAAPKKSPEERLKELLGEE